MSYFEDYKNERYHDDNLLRLIAYLDLQSKQEIIKKNLIIDVDNIGRYQFGKRKRDYDLHLEFEHAIICIETKVDSSENEYDTTPHYQTHRIYEKYKQAYEKETYFRYITYGASEFYVKKNDGNLFSTGPYSHNFTHIPLPNILTFIENSGVEAEDGHSEIKKWNKYLNYEAIKRNNYKEMLKRIRDFRNLYLDNSGLTDWPNNRVNICVPEILLYFYSMIAQAWNESQHKESFGGVSVYPVGRMGKVNDAILNFSELWDNCSLTLNGLIDKENALYFEFNEDFNLHLKCCATPNTGNKFSDICNFIVNHNTNLSLNGKYNAIPEHYKQGNYVLYEWDLRILDFIDTIELILPMISEVIGNATKILK